MHLFLLHNEIPTTTSQNKFIPSNSSFSTGSSSSSVMSINEQQQITTNLKRSGSAVIRARFEPEVDGVNRYKHFHRFVNFFDYKYGRIGVFIGVQNF